MNRRDLLKWLPGVSVVAAIPAAAAIPASSPAPVEFDKTLIGYAQCGNERGGCKQLYSFVRGANPICPQCGWTMFCPLPYVRLMLNGEAPVLTSALAQKLVDELRG